MATGFVRLRDVLTEGGSGNENGRTGVAKNDYYRYYDWVKKLSLHNSYYLISQRACAMKKPTFRRS
uniref:Uncharacterized protein n=1 Tax=Pristionchus pacificus TaxID=54126 RepID=A0A2A6C7H4_PRIPA|eukprot:PDM74162.1 hypothetical protein PRIPAC_41518 [Pristionchus pacificus]